ncbi:hypothetical protein [Halobaculum sp. MBLA0143]|uniref:hypothetical protein n=1 Tax=Halobaculum sp. MBLA0143 TaxID=3079933 RepID=UPI003523792E
MGSIYHTVTDGGDECADNRRAYVRLYPNSSSVEQYVQDTSSTLVSALQTALEELLAHGAINYYKIYRFHADDYYYPCVSTDGDIGGAFREFLDGSASPGCPNPNGTGDDLFSVIGAHTLVHNGECKTEEVSGGAGDDCGSSTEGSAFSTGRMCWTSATCSTQSSKVKAGAVQEPLHQFIMWTHPDVKSRLYDHDGGGIDHIDEHSLGRINSAYEVTPMLAYHELEFDPSETCNGSASDYGDTYTASLSECTKKAVEDIAYDSTCNDQPTLEGGCSS